VIDPTDKSAPRIAGMFDQIAGRYDFLNHVLSAGIDRRWRKRAIQSLDLTGREVVLDLCTGTADLAMAAVATQPPARRVLGLDFAGEMLKVGRAKLERARLADRVLLTRADATRIPVAASSVDAVTIAFGIRNVDDVRASCGEIARVLRPGGRLAILEFAMPTTPGLRQAYLWYFRQVLPRVGRLLSRHDAAYSYLPASVAAFPEPAEFMKILRQAGLARVSAIPLTFGIVYLYTAQR
jgi:demethylmenaquinone methyltransferase/2-methoxy-6-polyprenyl-1,4-benzoquinol methylase